MTNRIEELSLNAWPALVTRLYDGWVLRFADGYSNRANSVSPLYPSFIPAAQKILFCEKAYASQGLTCVFKITDDGDSADLDALLESAGYERVNPASVLLLDLTSFEPQRSDAVLIESSFSDSWLKNYAESSRLESRYHETLRNMLTSINAETAAASIGQGKMSAGCGYGVIEGNCMGIFNVYVPDSLRRQGYGRLIMQSLLSYAKDREVSCSYLQVMSANRPAIDLYQSLGYREIYRYWYRIRK